MSGSRGGIPQSLSRVFRWLLQGARGEEVCEELEHAYEKTCEKHRHIVAGLWYLAQLFHPRTWVLALELRSIHRAEEGVAPGARRGALGISWLDVKLGLRMLVKYPGLTCVAVFALAIGIPAGMSPMHIANVQRAPLPVDEGDRILALRYFNVATSRPQAPSPYHFALLREELTSFEAVALTSLQAQYNVISEDGRAAPVQGAAVTPSMFNILRVGPLLGRTLIPEDEVIGAPAVVVIGYDLWQSRLEGDPDVVGRTIRVGGLPRTVVGVMPREFRFPYRDHLWLPLRGNVDSGGPLPGRRSTHLAFGRLKDGISSDQAQAEFTAVHARMALEFGDWHARLQPEVVPFTYGLFRLPKGGAQAEPGFYLVQGLGMLLLLVACANVGMLIFARTASRSSELAVRTALGASRTRVISQLFTEALVLAVLAAGMGLFIADQIILVSLDWFLKTEPYWIDYGVTRETGLWALALAGFSAAAMSIVPALKVTGKAVQRSIQRARAGRSGVRFGGTSGALIVANVALAVVTVGVGVFVSSGLTGFRDDTGSLPEEFLSAELTIPWIALEPVPTPFDPIEYRARVLAIQQEFVRRLEAVPDIRGVAVGNVLPGVDYPARRVEVEDESRADDARGHLVRTARVDPGFFDALEQPILSGRGFDSGDLGEGSSTVIVSRTFVERVLDGRNPIGRRLRYTSRRDEEAGPWYEIVGLVGDLGTDGTLNLGDYGLDRTQGGVYHPFAGESRLLHLAVHVGEDPESYTSRLRALVGEFDPSFIISEPLALHDVVAESQVETRAVIWGTGALIGILIALSISGIYALMSFTVTERRREIGIRVALGAQRSRVMLTVARRSLAQLGIGILLGVPFAWRIVATTDAYMGHWATRSSLVLTLLLASSIMVLVGALACGAPTLRALRIMPTEALEDI